MTTRNKIALAILGIASIGALLYFGQPVASAFLIKDGHASNWLMCTDCHTDKNVSFSCIGCHQEVGSKDDLHAGMPSLECVACHAVHDDLEGANVREFQHDASLSWFFISSHNNEPRTCVRCHGIGQWQFQARDCLVCHETEPMMGDR